MAYGWPTTRDLPGFPNARTRREAVRRVDGRTVPAGEWMFVGQYDQESGGRDAHGDCYTATATAGSGKLSGGGRLRTPQRRFVTAVPVGRLPVGARAVSCWRNRTRHSIRPEM
jgi:hypothetical protein